MLDALRGAWAQLLSGALGLWLMAAPAVLGYGGPAADAHHVLGPMAASFALVAVWGHMRPLRWVNVFLGGALVVFPVVLSFSLAAAANSALVGLLLVGLGFIRGTVMEEYGGGWSALWTGNVSGEMRGDDAS